MEYLQSPEQFSNPVFLIDPQSPQIMTHSISDGPTAVGNETNIRWASVGDDIRLECRFDGFPSPKITWGGIQNSGKSASLSLPVPS